jgi:hypothetical protein
LDLVYGHPLKSIFLVYGEIMVWSGLVWSGLVWSGLVWSGLVWSGLLAECSVVRVRVHVCGVVQGAIRESVFGR